VGLKSLPAALAAGWLLGVFSPGARGQAVTNLIDQFNPGGTGGYNYASGQISNVWDNWFGGAFQSLVWDPNTDANNNSGSASMKVTANYQSTNNQIEIWDEGQINPPLDGAWLTNFSCDVMFAAGSATTVNGSGQTIYGHLQFGARTPSYGQDYFGSVEIPAGNNGWTHVNIPINANADANLASIVDVLVHIYGPYYAGAPLSGASTFWVDNIAFSGPPFSTNCYINYSNVFQRIDGFGASSAWNSGISTTQGNLLFSTNSNIVYTNNLGHKSTNNGIGLTLLRSRIAPGGTTVENGIMQQAQSLGARVWSTPWSPAASFKSNTNVNGGSFVGTSNNYYAYASQLAGYVASMKSRYGINLYAVSIQNEPDANVTTYESCNWTGQQIHDFAPFLYNALAASNVGTTKIMLPESQNWLDYSNLTVTAMSDPTVAADVAIIADHNYDGTNGPAVFSKTTYGKALWETEVCLLTGSDSSITNGVYYAERIYLFLTQAQANAWHYWWLISLISDGNEGLLDNNGATTKRLFTLGNYSRFVRPNYYRIGVSNTSAAFISAYKDSASPNFAIVAVNTNSTDAQPQTFILTNFLTTGSVTPWITSAAMSLSNQAPVTVNNTSFSYTLPPLSVVTFVGQASTNTAPVLAPVADQTINAGVTLRVTNRATDAESPPQTLTFSLLAGPANSTLGAASGVFTWRPAVAQEGTTNPVNVSVTDNGLPPLSATNRFRVIVNPLTPAIVGAIKSGASGGASISVSGPQGPDYTLLMATNLPTANWQALFTTNSPMPPVTLVDTNNSNMARFYRVKIGP
jgi:glucuronoarabinoxylan endo-1,4-beta-xylanase